MKVQEAELWCPRCHAYYAQIFRVEEGPGIWRHQREPENVPTKCTACNVVIERKE